MRNLSSRRKKNFPKRLLPLAVLAVGLATLINLSLYLLTKNSEPVDSLGLEAEAEAFSVLENDFSFQATPSSALSKPLGSLTVPIEVAESQQIPNLENLQKLLMHHMDAMGGWRNWNQVESICTRGIITRDNKNFPLVVVKKKPHLVRATVTLPAHKDNNAKIQVIRGHDGLAAWSAMRLVGELDIQKEALSKDDADELYAETGVLPPLIKFWQEDAAIQLLGLATIEGTLHYKLRVQPIGMDSHYVFYLSSVDHRVHQYEYVKNNIIVNRVFLKEYAEHKGVVVPMIIITQSELTGDSIVTTSSVEIGVGIYNDYFDPDQSIVSIKL